MNTRPPADVGTHETEGPLGEAARGLELGGVFLLAAVVTSRVLLFDFQDPSAENSLVTTATALLAGLALARALLAGELALPPAGVSAPLGFLLLLGLVATVFAVHRWPAELELVSWATHALVFLSAWSLFAPGREARANGGAGPPVHDPDLREQIRSCALACILATALVVALFGILQRAAILPALDREIASTSEGRRLLAIPGAVGLVRAKQAFSTFLNPNVFSGYIALVLPVACGAALSAASRGRRGAAAASCASAAALAAALLLTRSLGGLLAAGFGLAIAALLVWRRKLAALVPSGRRAWRYAALGAGAIALACAAWFLLRSPSIGVRLEYWRATCAMIAEHPLGVGLGGFSDFYTFHKTPAGWETREAHNVYLGLAAEAGMAALAAFGLLLRGFGRAVRPTRCDAPLADAVSIEATGGRDAASPAGREPNRRPAPEGDPALRALALAGGLAGILAAYVVGAATGLGTRASSIGEMLAGGADWRSCIVGIAHIAFLPAWGAVFWLLSGARGPARGQETLAAEHTRGGVPLASFASFTAEPGSRFEAAGVLGGLAALFVHGLVEFDFRVKSIMLTACVLGAFVLSARAQGTGPCTPVRLRLDGARRALALAVGAILLAGFVWRGGFRTLGLWERAALARAEAERASHLDRGAWKCQSWLSQEGRADSPPADASLARSLDELAADPALSLEVAEARAALGSTDRARARSAVSALASRAREEASASLERAWRLAREYLEIEPGDERVCLELAGLSERLAARARGEQVRFSRGRGRSSRPDARRSDPTAVSLAELEGSLERALQDLAELSPASFSAYLALGRFHANLGRLPQAASALEKAAARYPLRPETWLLLGDARVFFDPALAVAAYARALEVNRIVEDENTMLFARLWSYSPRRPASGDLAARLDEAESALGPSAEIAFRKGLLLAEIGGFREAAGEFARARALRPEEAQIAAFRALALEMESARQDSPSAREEAEAAWAEFRSLQARCAATSRLNEFAAGLFELRKWGLHAAARGELP